MGTDNPIPDTTQQVEEAATDVTASLERMARAFEGLAPHLEKLVSEGVRFHPIEAAKQVPAAASQVAEGAGAAAGETVSGAGHVVAAAPAVVSDTLETTQDVGKGAAKTAKRYTLRKRRG